MVGDKDTDIVPARELGMRTILVRTGYGASMESTTVADLVESDIAAAVQHILEQSTTTR
jgi:ribonucleotide monophosphatase NagD (HAD superfamily)